MGLYVYENPYRWTRTTGQQGWDGNWWGSDIHNMQDGMLNRYEWIWYVCYERTREGNWDRALCFGMKRALDPGGVWGVGREDGPGCIVPDSLLEIGDMGDIGEITGFSALARGVCVVEVKVIWDVPDEEEPWAELEGIAGRFAGAVLAPEGGFVAGREGPGQEGLRAPNTPALRIVSDLAFSNSVLGAGFFPPAP
jgi:hypothetical protein